jgi:tRNA1Val (adenine37-N6)-methyltransferase
LQKDVIAIKPGETINGLLRNKIRVIQARRGYRVSEDTIILTWFTRPEAGELFLDAGAGCGVIAFGLLAMQPTARVVGLEIQHALADRAHRGAKLNEFESKVLIIRGDLREADRFFRPTVFDVVVSNPPYYEPGRGRINLQEEKALSRHQMMMPPEDLFRVSSKLLKAEGRLSLIYPVTGLDRIKKVMNKTGFGVTRMLWIQSQPDVEPGLVCLEAKLGDKPPPEENVLCLYEKPGKRTSEAAQILAGENWAL